MPEPVVGEWSAEGRSEEYNPLANALGRAAEAGDAAMVERLLAGGAEADAWVPGGRRALDLAVCAGWAEVVRQLVEAGADPGRDAGPYDEATPMALAAMNGHTAVARVLLDAGADPCGPAGRMRYVPLVLAATHGECGSPATVDLLLDRGADPEERMRDRTALEWAARFGHQAVVEQLIARGAAVTERAVREAVSGRGFRTRTPDSGHRIPAYERVVAALRAALGT
ncbi:ankyrin repeat domain-containing protein [Streptomyces sp. NPDC096339]|uniref:ankyrin repeat domain-containing protein n=1 Tax=Streptomyces sp. NPDC096339 TaxID=3366086 RepID=UPI00382DB0AF